MRAVRLVDATLSFYPAWWRDIYEEEMRTVTGDLVAQGRHPWRLAADLMR